MGILRSLTSGMNGLLWLVRPGGLREQMRRQDEVAPRLQQLAQRLAAPADGILAVTQEERRQAVQAQWLRAGDLRAFEKRRYSQNGEDGILEEILNRIGTACRFFVEFGVESGAECNCAL